MESEVGIVMLEESYAAVRGNFIKCFVRMLSAPITVPDFKMIMLKLMYGINFLSMIGAFC